MSRTLFAQGLYNATELLLHVISMSMCECLNVCHCVLHKILQVTNWENCLHIAKQILQLLYISSAHTQQLAHTLDIPATLVSAIKPI